MICPNQSSPARPSMWLRRTEPISVSSRSPPISVTLPEPRPQQMSTVAHVQRYVVGHRITGNEVEVALTDRTCCPARSRPPRPDSARTWPIPPPAPRLPRSSRQARSSNTHRRFGRSYRARWSCRYPMGNHQRNSHRYGSMMMPKLTPTAPVQKRTVMLPIAQFVSALKSTIPPAPTRVPAPSICALVSLRMMPVSTEAPISATDRPTSSAPAMR